MGTGKQRLTDMHKGKKQAREKAIEKLLKNIDPIEDSASSKCTIHKFKAPDSSSITNKPLSVKKKAGSKTKSDPILQNEDLNEVENQFFQDIYSRLEKIHPDPEKYILSAKNLAKILAIQKRLKERLERDGTEILENEDGKFYPHPALTLMQRNYSLILSNLKALGIVSPRAMAKKDKEEQETFVSDFAQF